MKKQNNYFYDFGSFRIDTLKRNLLYNGQDLQIKPKAFETLLFLVERHGEIVSKEELLNTVWSDTFVEENNLTQQISALRKNLGKFGDEEFIITIPKQGYQFVQPVKEVSYDEKFVLLVNENSFAPAPKISEKETIWNVAKQNPLKALIKFFFQTQLREITLGCILMGLVVWFSIYIEDHQAIARAATVRKSIAVLEFEPLDGNAKSSLYSAGITRTLTAKIGNLKMMVLRPAGSSERFYGQERDVIAIGNQLQADIVVEGSVQSEGELVRIAVIAWDSKANRQIWGDVFTRDSANAFMMQDEVTKKVISAVQSNLLN